MYRYALTIEYDGSPFHGWQVQNSITTVQGVVFDAIKKLDMNCENFVGAGRTDAGVHAIGQVAHVDLATKRDCETVQKWLINWVPMANIKVEPCLDDNEQRELILGREPSYRIVYDKINNDPKEKESLL